MVLRAITAAYVVTVIVGTLYPFHFAEPQRVFDLRHHAPRWDDTAGIRFEGAGVFATTEPLRGLRQEIADAGGLILRLDLLPESTHRPHPRRIVGLESPAGRAGLTVNQRGPDLLVRTAGPGQSTTEAVFDGVLDPGRFQWLTLDVDTTHIHLTWDGVVAGQAEAPLSPERWPKDIRLVVGNGADGRSGWAGTVRTLELRPRDADAPRVIVDPTNPPDGSWLATKTDLEGNHAESPWSLVPFSEPAGKRWARADWAQNLALFIPLGMMLWGVGFRWPYILLTAFLLSFGIETAQVFIPTRHAQMSDVVLNSAGGPLGALLVAGLARLFARG